MKRVIEYQNEDVFRAQAEGLSIIGYGRSSVAIDGEVITGWMDKGNECPQCNAPLIYYEDYDGTFCPECNVWLSSTCCDPECDFCTKRPSHPLKGLSSE